jgi:hypothetical protein
MLRKPAFWIIFAALSITAAIFTFTNFSTAFPLVSIDLKMDREAALRAAGTLADRNVWPPAGYDQAVEFSGDPEVQNFIELEGGGKPELSRILREKIFASYTWRVRHFKESDAHETLVRFTPEGEPYGFRVKLPEQEAGSSKPDDEARQIAESAAQQDWKTELTRYRLVESSKEVRPGGRTDHTFVYERQDQTLREGRYRLRLVVGGDKLTELTHFVQVPEAFSRRYQELRSANDAIGAAGSVAVFAFYIFGICGVGLFFMMRQRWVLWREAVFWAVLIASLMALQHINSWSLHWMSYDTAVPASGFAFLQIATAVGIFGGLSALMAVSFVAAETLSRRAFPHHAQLWKIWSQPAAAAKPVLGQTVSGYLLVAPFFVYEIVLYFVAQQKLGWWSPSDALANPNLFANYVPSLSAISLAAQAGFWEESLFRAVPLAAAALIGDRFGKRRTFIIGAMILQSLIFAAGHAGYANQPAYARVVELIIPSLGFGALYLAFGLLPGIVLHYAYDVAWMALPLFVASGTRAHIEQAIVLVFVLVPLWVVLGARWRAGRWVQEVPHEALNAAWQPRESHDIPQPEVAAVPVAGSISRSVSRLLPVAGLIGLALWISLSRFETDVSPITANRPQVEQSARQGLSDRGIQLDSSWRVLSRVEGQPGEPARFVWQKAGAERYTTLVGTYLTPPRWVVRFARFEGDVAERAEEYQVVVDGDGRVFRVRHLLPEARAGKSLTVDEARTIAQTALKSNFQMALENVKEVSAEAAKRPARGDWTFTFTDTRDYGLPEGEPRISIEIAGDEVVDAARFVYVPEEWLRDERRQRNLPVIFQYASAVALVGIALGGAVLGIVRWSRKRAFSARAFFLFLVVVFSLSATNLLNNWPTITSQLPTAQPLELQAAIIVAVSLLLSVFTAAALALIAGLVTSAPELSRPVSLGRGLILGVSLGLAVAGAGALARQVPAPTGPSWGNLAPASTLLPVVASALNPLSTVFTQALILAVVLFAVAYKRHGSALFILVGVILAGSAIESIPSWLLIGVMTGIVLMVAHLLVLRHEPKLIIPMTATISALSAVRDGVQGMHPAALAGAIAAVILIAAAAVLWLRASSQAAAARRDLVEFMDARH